VTDGWPDAYERGATKVGIRVDGEHSFDCRCSVAFRERFAAAKSRSEARLGMDMTHAEFLELLLDVWEEYEEPRGGPR